MTYAGSRHVVDADSHLMEWPTFLTDHADPRFRDRMPTLARIPGVAHDSAHHSGDQRAELLALGEQHRALDGVAHFADVARPLILLEHRHRFR